MDHGRAKCSTWNMVCSTSTKLAQLRLSLDNRGVGCTQDSVRTVIDRAHILWPSVFNTKGTKNTKKDNIPDNNITEEAHERRYFLNRGSRGFPGIKTRICVIHGQTFDDRGSAVSAVIRT